MFFSCVCVVVLGVHNSLFEVGACVCVRDVWLGCVCWGVSLSRCV